MPTRGDFKKKQFSIDSKSNLHVDEQNENTIIVCESARGVPQNARNDDFHAQLQPGAVQRKINMFIFLCAVQSFATGDCTASCESLSLSDLQLARSTTAAAGVDLSMSIAVSAAITSTMNGGRLAHH